MSSSYKTLTVTRSADGYIVTVELHRPEALNAMNTAMGEDLLRCFDAFTWDHDGARGRLRRRGREGLLRGRRPEGARGHDRRGVARPAPDLRAGAPRACSTAPCRSSPRSRASRWAAAASWPSLSDLIVASETAVFAVPEVTRGIFPGIGGTQLLPRIIGAPAREGDDLHRAGACSAQEAKAIGLVNHLVPKGQARAKALEIAATIADNGPIAVRQAKKAVNWGSETDLETGDGAGDRGVQQHRHHRGPAGGRARVQREAQARVPGAIDVGGGLDGPLRAPHEMRAASGARIGKGEP